VPLPCRLLQLCNMKQATAGMKTCIPYITLGRAVFGLSGQN
jgi:hypothetical protein